MSKASAGFTMSLDGFIAGPDDSINDLFKWYFGGDIAVPVPDTDMVFKVAPASAPIISELFHRFGAILTGRRDFEVSRAWGGKHPMDVPVFIVTHSIPPTWAGKDSPFTFVTEGVERALELAKQAAGDKDVAVGGSTITQQLLQAGLLDEIHIDLAPVLLGQGIRLFDRLEKTVELERTRVIEAPDVTHITFKVLK